MTETSSELTEAERRVVTRTRWLGNLLWAGALPLVFCPMLFRGPLSRMGIDATLVSVAMIPIYCLLCTLYLWTKMRCFRCRASLVGLKAKSEWGAVPKLTAQCPKCGATVGDMF